MRRKAIRDKCPMGLEDVVLTLVYLDALHTKSDAPQAVLRILGKTKPSERAQVKGWVELSCSSMDYSHLPRHVMAEKVVSWCKKRGNICPMQELARALLREKGYKLDPKDFGLVEEPLDIDGM